MNERHEANRRHWDNAAAGWRALRDRDGLWTTCVDHPDVAFEGDAFEQIRRFCPDLNGRRVCVVGSGDNYAAFALAGRGARVTSVDISERQLQIAEERARSLGLRIDFVRADATCLSGLESDSFDLVLSTNGFFVWIAEPGKLFEAVYLILKRGGAYVFYDIHPFQRPWAADVAPLRMEKPYGDRGPYVYDEDGACYEHHWTAADLLNPLSSAGFVLKHFGETTAASPRFWQDFSYEPSSADRLLDWRYNARAGLPVWLTVAAQKP